MKKNLSHILINSFGVSEEDINEARRIKAEKGDLIRDMLVTKKIITEMQLMEALSIQYDIPFRPVLRYDNFTTDFTNIVPIQFLKKYIMHRKCF